jgi:hypothetical protein
VAEEEAADEELNEVAGTSVNASAAAVVGETE